MNLYDQVKTSQGKLPVVDAHIAPEEGEVRFEIAQPERVASDDAFPMAENLSIEEFSVVESLSALERFARASGPLFGANACEPVADWQSALAVARAVVVLQEVVNGGKPIACAEDFTVKTKVSSAYGGCDFIIYFISFDMGQAGVPSLYRDIMPAFPRFRKFTRGKCFDYAFFQIEEEAGRVCLSASLVSFSREISLRDFSTVASYFEGVPERVFFEGFSGRRSEAEGGAFSALAGSGGDLAVQDALIDEEDLPHLQNFVYALISLHFQDIAIDVFRSTEDDDFMTFDTFLSYLWYGFSRKLGQVKIGYCEQCGAGFSLTGHRGIRRRFCSEACKTKAKNERSRRVRDAVRERFASGERIEAIAREVYAAEERDVAERHAVAQLRGWKTLQRDVDAALVVPGFACDVLDRCIAQGVFSADEVEQRARIVKGSSYLAKQARRHAEETGGGPRGEDETR